VLRLPHGLINVVQIVDKDQGFHTSYACSFLVHKYLLQTLTFDFGTLGIKEWLRGDSTYPVVPFLVQREEPCVVLWVSSKAPQALAEQEYAPGMS